VERAVHLLGHHDGDGGEAERGHDPEQCQAAGTRRRGLIGHARRFQDAEQLAALLLLRVLAE
jgi:hypothetical protein